MTTYRHTLIGARPPEAPEPWTHVRIEGTTDLLVAPVEIETVALSPLDDDPAFPQSRTVTTDLAPFPTGYLRLVFIDAGGQETAPSDFVASPGVSEVGWAPSENDVAIRLGRDLTSAETAAANFAIATTIGLIADTAGLTLAELGALDPAPATLKTLCVEKAIGVIVNPLGIAVQSEQLGAFQHSETFPRSSDIGVFLSDDEQRRVRRAVGLATFGAVTLESPYSGTALDDLPDLPL